MPDTPSDALIAALTRATADGRLVWSRNPAGNAKVHGTSAILIARNGADGPCLTVQDPTTGHQARLSPEIYPGLEALLKQAAAAAEASRETLVGAALELRHSRMPDSYSDPTGILALTRALAHATRRHALTWTRLSSENTTIYTVQAAGTLCQLAATPADTPSGRALTLTALQDDRPLAVLTEPLDEGPHPSPSNELLRCIRLANAETAREMLQEQPAADGEVILDLLAELI